MQAMTDFKDAADPLSILGPDVFQLVTTKLDAACLGKCLLVSTSWRDICGGPELWIPHCQALWKGKRYVPDDFKADSIVRRAYARSLRDCQRTTITATELCSFAWTFKFKHQVLDQNSTGTGNEMIRYFHYDGSYIIGDNDCPYQHPHYRWQFLTHKDGRPGLYMQINRFPYLSITRTEDWGWKMENPWVTFTSNPRHPPTALAQQKLPSCPASTRLAHCHDLLGH